MRAVFLVEKWDKQQCSVSCLNKELPSREEVKREEAAAEQSLTTLSETRITEGNKNDK